jgi:RNA polymerase sigma factor (sigma-70 family)
MASLPQAYEHHGPAVLAFLRRRLWNSDDAEDLCQETFLRVIKAEPELRDTSKLRLYLFRTANNLLIDHLRRRVVVSSESELGEHHEIARYADPGPTSPAAWTEWSELNDKLQNLMADLPRDQRTAFELGVIQRKPYADIAREKGWSVGKVKVDVCRARKQLMAGLRDFMPDASRPDGRK